MWLNISAPRELRWSCISQIVDGYCTRLLPVSSVGTDMNKNSRTILFVQNLFNCIPVNRFWRGPTNYDDIDDDRIWLGAQFNNFLDLFIPPKRAHVDHISFLPQGRSQFVWQWSPFGGEQLNWCWWWWWWWNVAWWAVCWKRQLVGCTVGHNECQVEKLANQHPSHLCACSRPTRILAYRDRNGDLYGFYTDSYTCYSQPHQRSTIWAGGCRTNTIFTTHVHVYYSWVDVFCTGEYSQS